MSVIDDLKRRIDILEKAAGGDTISLANRIRTLEEILGLTSEPIEPLLTNNEGQVLVCHRCGNKQTASSAARCPQEKCPLK